MYMHKSGKVRQSQVMGGIAMEYYINACERANMKFLHTNANYIKKEKRKHATEIAVMSRSKSEGKLLEFI
jgi:hypothetical protein